MDRLTINVPTNIGHSVEVELASESSSGTLFLVDLSIANENGEAPYQVQEGYSYEYRVTEGFSLEEMNGIVWKSRLKKNQGRITPNIYVGTLSINVLKSTSNEKVGEFVLEVRSVKTSYREDYRLMLEEITEKCAELLLQAESPVSQFFTIDFNADAKTLYQRFAFINATLTSGEFIDAIHKFLASPITRWAETEVEKDIRATRRIKNKELRQIATASNRVSLPSDHPLSSDGIPSMPSKIKTSYKKETIDTPENRFVKYALQSFQVFCSDFRTKVKKFKRLIKEASLLENKLEQYLSHAVFKEISSLSSMPSNSPVLQRKEGYREIFRVWLMFDLAAKLIWHGGEDVYCGNKKDVAVLYEYWLFFKLLDLIKDVFNVEPSSIEALIEPTADGLGLKLKQGKHTPVIGIYNAPSRKLNVQFSYNRTFEGDNGYPSAGSWSRSLRPDYTLSIWPYGIGQKEAEEEELITHIHFDAKYRVETLATILGNDDSITADEDYLKDEKAENQKGIYKRADLLKMHAYKDAIRRTAGAYVLYPGTESKRVVGFHEVLPGLGAFAIKPSKNRDGILELREFLIEVVNHFLNRASQREKIALRTYEIFRENDSNDVTEALPESIGANRLFNPDDVYVLIAYYKDAHHLRWITNHKLYNARTGSVRGSLHLSQKEVSARYLLLHSEGETKTGKLFKLSQKGPRMFSKKDMLERGYQNPSNDFYLVYDVTGLPEKELVNLEWDITKLGSYSTGRGSGLPFAVTLTELMQVKS